MSESSSETSSPRGAATHNSAPKHVGWLVGWIAALAAMAILLARGNLDPGIGTIAFNAALILSVISFAVWAALWSGRIVRTRCLISAASLVLLAAFYAQLMPFQLINDGDAGIVGVRWRWNQPDKLLAMQKSETDLQLDWREKVHDYPRFLGSGYWAEVPGVALEVDWKTSPPREVWRTKIGAGWSAFSIVGSYAVTQEQRDEQELVTCYELSTGKIVWTHADPVRWDPRGGGSLGYVGPRATPTIHQRRVYALGATGILNCIDGPSGKLRWSHDTLRKHSADNVVWGKACSPLIVDDLVVVSVGGRNNQSLVAYDMDSGDVVWAAGSYPSSYASPVLAEFAGQAQVISVNAGFVTAHKVEDGELLWEYEWPSDSGSDAATSQPVPLEGDRLFLSKGYGLGSALVQVTCSETGVWETTPLWKGRQYGQLPVMKTKMGNVVIRDGYVFGLDNVSLQCIELESGKRLWKKRRNPTFGHGQIMLIGDVILALTEFGEVVLVEASPDKYRELASIRVFSDDQVTWNNPAFAPPYLLVRNAEDAACYELPLKEPIAGSVD
ncbi:MAG: PQQ-like beta-propeller repeat protein [Pirellulales bacterium]|nr:PQQ-like beta-propeller repeat protein [Pirellulales bacterium]